jgi:hypothetical protein
MSCLVCPSRGFVPIGADRNVRATVHRFPSRQLNPTSAPGHSRRYCHARSLVRNPQHRTLPRPTQSRLLVAFLRPICKQRARPPQLLRLGSLDLATRDARAVTKIRRIDCNELARNLLSGCLFCFFVRSQFGEGSRRNGEGETADRSNTGAVHRAISQVRV